MGSKMKANVSDGGGERARPLPEAVIRYVRRLSHGELLRLTEEKIARRFHVNTGELSRRFRDYTHFLLSDYIRFARMMFSLKREGEDALSLAQAKALPFEALYTIDRAGEILIKKYVRFHPLFCDEMFITAEIVPHVLRGGREGDLSRGKHFSLGIQFFDQWMVFKIVILAVETTWIQFSVQKT